MSEELTDTPRYLKILGEELVAFRDRSGRVGLLHLHCAHRGASLEYGMIQERGIMCCYHGFVFDVDGMCLEVPFPKGEEQEAARAKEKICQGAYKAFERDGLVFAYMGPPEEEPPFPDWENGFTVHPDDHLAAYSNFQTCNWLQVQDNSADQYHPPPWCRDTSRAPPSARRARLPLWCARTFSTSRSTRAAASPGHRRAGSTRNASSSG
jgi:phenylpropionate dioxygenase-like ring-hydroxylating dioxygenase large terminal subunit